MYINDTRHDFWSNIDWIKVNKIVNNLQSRIFVEKRQGNFRKLRKLQNLLLSSKANKLLAVSQVCSRNSGNNIVSVDRRVYATPKEKMKLILQLYDITLNKWKPVSVKRIYNRKTKKLRFFDIPTLTDRALQAIVINALEPEWEATFEPSSYGFRKSRSAHDTIAYLHTVCNSKSSKYWVLHANIKNCFDNIYHTFLMNQLSNFPAKELILKWLKAGYIDNLIFHDSFLGTQQRIISPLLTNIALNGMEEVITNNITNRIGIKISKRDEIKSAHILIRYADDFIIACKTKESAIKIKQKINIWLKLRGLYLFSDKTRIFHVSDGFDFLGFNVKLYKTNNSSKLLIKPSLESQIKIRKKLKTIWKNSLGFSVKNVIKKINLILKGWANYYKIGVSSRIFKKIDYYNCLRQYRFAKRTHPMKSWKWIKAKYWGKLCISRNEKLIFGCFQSGYFMHKLSCTFIKSDLMVKGHH